MPTLYKLLFTVVALACLVGASFFPDATEPMFALSALIVGAVWVRRPGDTQGGPRTPPGAVLLVLLLGACTPAQRAGIPLVSQADAVGMGLANVLGWCEDHDADGRRLMEALQALQSEDYHTAAAHTSILLRELGEREAVPRDMVATLRLVEGALAAQAVQDGMRALSGDGS